MPLPSDPHVHAIDGDVSKRFDGPLSANISVDLEAYISSLWATIQITDLETSLPLQNDDRTGAPQ